MSYVLKQTSTVAEGTTWKHGNIFAHVRTGDRDVEVQAFSGWGQGCKVF